MPPRTRTLLAAAGAVAAVMWGLPAQAGELFQQGALAQGDLAQQRGGWEPLVVDQTNITHNEGSNTDNTIVNSGDGASFSTGEIAASALSDNSGVTSLMQNTGNVVNMNYAMSVNVYLQ